MSQYLIEAETLTSLADAIREKTGRTDGLTLWEMEEAVDGIVVEDNSAALVDGSLTEYENGAVTSIGSYAFAYCTSLTLASFPACASIGSNAFSFCTSLISVNFPVCTNIGSYAFAYCSSLTSVSFPVCTSIGYYAFSSCTSLISVNFPVCTSISSYAFNQCSSLTSLYLTGSSVATLANINAFYNTPMSVSTYTGSFGSIYVPSSLVASYQAATNWATYSDRITAVQ